MLTQYLNTLKDQGNLTFDDIEKKSGIPKDTIKNIFTGKTKAPGTDTLVPIIYAMGGSLDAAFGHAPKESTTSATMIKELYDNYLKDVKEHYEHRLSELKEHYVELKERNAEMKERHEERISEINEHIKTIRLDKRWFRIATCILATAFVALLVAEVLLPGHGWIQY